MDIKSITVDIQEAIINTWGSLETCQETSKILALHDKLSLLRDDFKQAKEEKNQVAKQFKENKDNPPQLEILKDKMQIVSGKLNEIQGAIKVIEAQLIEYFQKTEKRERPTLPERFTAKTPENIGTVSDISIIPLEPGRYTTWDTYVAQHPKSTPYHKIAWKKIIEGSFNHYCHYFVALNQSNNIVGVLPVTALQSKLFGHFGISIPFVNYGGPLADSKEICQRLVDHANNSSELKDCSHIEYRLYETLLNLPVNNKKVSMILPLPSSEEVLDNQLGAKVRAQFNQATRHAVDIKFGGIELLDDYYTVFATNMRDLGTPVYAKSLFKNILEMDKGNNWICVAYVDKRPAGTAFLCGHKEMLEIPWASTIKKYNNMNVNMWMYRKILGFAISKNFDYFDFGRSTKDAGTYKFKKQWGALPVQHHWFYHLASGRELPQINPDNPKYKLAIAVWRRIPVLITKIIGPPIVKFLG